MWSIVVIIIIIIILSIVGAIWYMHKNRFHTLKPVSPSPPPSSPNRGPPTRQFREQYGRLQIMATNIHNASNNMQKWSNKISHSGPAICSQVINGYILPHLNSFVGVDNQLYKATRVSVETAYTNGIGGITAIINSLLENLEQLNKGWAKLRTNKNYYYTFSEKCHSGWMVNFFIFFAEAKENGKLALKLTKQMA